MTRLAGNIITDPGAVPRYGEVVVEGLRITRVELLGPVEAGTEYILPGFIDAHTHPVETGLQMLFPDLRETRTMADMRESLVEGMAFAREHGVLMAFNLDPERVAEQRLPTRHEVDAVAGDLPAIVYRIDGHSAVLNRAGFELLAEPWPAGVARDQAGMPAGVVCGQAYEAFSELLKRRLQPALLRQAIAATAKTALRQGITTLAAMVGSPGLTPAEWEVLGSCVNSDDVSMSPFLQTWQAENATRLGLPRVGGCLLLDGSFGSRTAALTDAYSDQPGNRGICYRRDEDVADLIEAAHTHGLQTAFHSIGDRAVAQLVSIHERLRKERENPLRHRIEHGELLDTTLVQRISGLDLVLGVQPAFEAAWGGPSGMYARRLGPRWARTNPLRSLATAGVKLAGGSDAPITPLDPLTGVRAAMTHPNEVERLDGPSALALFTTGAAYSLGLEDRTGRIASGMDADLVVLDADPRTGAPCRVLATYRRGRSAYHASTSVPTQP